MLRVKCIALGVAAVLVNAAGPSTAACGAIVLANWTFETSIPTSAGPHLAEAGVFATGSFASGFHSDSATGFSSPIGNGSDASFSSNRWSIGDWYQFTTSTIGYENIVFGWDQTRSSTGPGLFKVEADFGSGFVDVLDAYSVAELGWSRTSTRSGSVFDPIALGVDAADLTSISVRLTALEAGTTTGTNRVDNIVISGTAMPTATVAVPEPNTLVMMGLGALLLVFWRRRGQSPA